MKYGMNLLLWTAELNDDLMPILERLKEIGFDGVEVPIFNTELDYRHWGRRLDDLGLERTAVAVCTAETNPISSDAEIRAQGVAANKRVIECCAALGASILCGPLHSALGEFSGAGPTGAEWDWGVESTRQLAEHSDAVGVTLALEPLNRFEIYLLNSAADAVRFAREVNHPNCQVLIDTFHSHIEEKNVADALRASADFLGEVHISENDRSTPGQGQVDWESVFDALNEIGYDGWLMIEAFGTALPELAAATKIWRRMYADEFQLAADGLAFMKTEVEKRR